MTNPFYNASGNPGDRAPGSSQTMRAEFVSIQQGFDKLPTSLSPNTVVVVNPGGTALTTTAYALALGGALTLAGAFTTTGPYATTLAQQANTTLTLPASNATLATLALAETLTNKTLTAPVVNTPTVNNGTFNAPVLVTPQLGTPASGNLSNCTALPIATGVSGLAAGVATFLGTPSSANLLAAMTDETGTGPLVFATSPTLNTPTLNSPSLVTPNLGTPSAGNLANCTNLPINGGTTGTLAVNRGGTGTGTTYAAGGVIFAGASGVYTADGALNWDNTNKSLGVGRAAGGSAWRLAVSSQGTNNFPLVVVNNTSTITGFYVQDAAGGFNVNLNDAGNATRVFLNSAGNSYFSGGSLGVGTTSPVAYLGVQDPSGNLTPDDVFRAGSTGYARFLRMGVTGALINGAVGNQAPYIQSNYNNSKALNYVLLLNPAGGGVSVGSSRESAAALDVFGNVTVNDGGYFYTAYNGVTNTGTVRAGIQVDGANQSINFYTANALRAAVIPGGNFYLTGRLGVSMSPVPSWTSVVQAVGDISMTPAVSSLLWNAYYDGAWRYANNGWPAAFRTDGAGLFQLLGGPQNVSGAGAAYTPTAVTTWNLTTGSVAIGPGNPAGTNRLLTVYGNINGEHALWVNNLSLGANANSILYVDLGSVANGYAAWSVNSNSGAPFARLGVGAGITQGILYDAANGKHGFYSGAVERLRIESTAVTVLGVPLNSTYTGGNQFGILLLQGLTGSGGYVRTQDNTNLYLGANGGNVVAVHSSNSYFYPVSDNVVQSGASGNRWSQVHTFAHYVWGTGSGYTILNSQVNAANNIVTLPPYTGTLLIGGTQLSANLGGDVALNNTGSYFNGPSIALPAGGTWFVTAGLTLQDYNSAANFEVRLIEGSNVYASALTATWASGAGTTVVLSGFLPGGTTARIQAIGNSSVFGRILATTLGGGGGQPNATWMRAVRVA